MHLYMQISTHNKKGPTKQKSPSARRQRGNIKVWTHFSSLLLCLLSGQNHWRLHDYLQQRVAWMDAESLEKKVDLPLSTTERILETLRAADDRLLLKIIKLLCFKIFFQLNRLLYSKCPFLPSKTFTFI